MKNLYKKKDHLLYQLTLKVAHFGLTHPATVKKSQELDAVINQIMKFDQMKQKVS